MKKVYKELENTLPQTGSRHPNGAGKRPQGTRGDEGSDRTLNEYTLSLWGQLPLPTRSGGLNIDGGVNGMVLALSVFAQVMMK